MLPRRARLTSPNDFARSTKSGIRLTSKSLVLYLYTSKEAAPARFGLIISKSVGGSVVRHRIARQIRHAFHNQMSVFPPGSLVVARVLPHTLKVDLQTEISQLTRKIIEKSVISQ